MDEEVYIECPNCENKYTLIPPTVGEGEDAEQILPEYCSFCGNMISLD